MKTLPIIACLLGVFVLGVSARNLDVQSLRELVEAVEDLEKRGGGRGQERCQEDGSACQSDGATKCFAGKCRPVCSSNGPCGAPESGATERRGKGKRKPKNCYLAEGVCLKACSAEGSCPTDKALSCYTRDEVCLKNCENVDECIPPEETTPPPGVTCDFANGSNGQKVCVKVPATRKRAFISKFEELLNSL